MNYILGRNPLDQSYVTGYGERPLMNPHHRFWAHQANAKFPSPPPGVVSGGPNSGLQDPYVQAAGLAGCAPQKCFVDNIEAWSANEMAINWNAPLAWVAAFLDEKGGPAGGGAGKGGAAGGKKGEEIATPDPISESRNADRGDQPALHRSQGLDMSCSSFLNSAASGLLESAMWRAFIAAMPQSE